MKSLSGRERALLVIRAVGRGEEPDPQWRMIDDPVQSRIFDRAMGYLNAVNHDITAAVQSIRFHVERLENLRLLELLLEGADLLDAESATKANRRSVLAGRKRKNVTPAEYLLGLAEAERRELLDYALTLCGHMAAVDAVHDELAAEFDGEELRERDMQQTGELVWTKLRALVNTLGGPKDLPGPDEDAVEMLQIQVERSFKFFRLVEPALRHQQPPSPSVGTPLEPL